MDATCHRCERPTWVIWETLPWCHEDFLTEQAARHPGNDAGDADRKADAADRKAEVADRKAEVTTAGPART